MIKPEVRLISSLEKVFCRNTLEAKPIERLDLLKCETGSFQVALKCEDALEVRCEVRSPLADFAQIREVGLVPTLMPSVPDDPYVLTTEPGLFPNPLFPHVRPLYTVANKWHAFWISFSATEDFPAGEYPLEILLHYRKSYSTEPETTTYSIKLTVNIRSLSLAPQRLKVTNWFHGDCLMTRYQVSCWSEEYWRILANYFRDMTAHGLNMILTPLWTLPLDTEPDTERPTVQLLKIKLKNDRYHFDFSLLERWIDLALASGFEYLEFSHAFTQWGAYKTPKIMVEIDGEEKRLFGWDVAADSEEYHSFLSQLLPQLTAFLDAKNLRERCYFHVSDEPMERHLESYRQASQLMTRYLKGYKIMDALSDVDFFRLGYCQYPVPATPHLEHFTNEPLAERWVYYCGNWQEHIPNRQFGMASIRNRIIGVLFFVYDLDGFLNWAYNFWYSKLSRYHDLDPYHDPNAGRGFYAGGSFQVYPGKDRHPVCSIHYEVFRDALQDLRSLKMLEEKLGRDRVLQLLHRDLDYQLTLNQWPDDPDWLLNLRQEVNILLED